MKKSIMCPLPKWFAPYALPLVVVLAVIIVAVAYHFRPHPLTSPSLPSSPLPPVDMSDSSSASGAQSDSGILSSVSGSVQEVDKTVVSTGDTVSVQYTGRLEDGTIFDSSREEDAKKSTHYRTGRSYGDPLTFKVGDGGMIKGFDQGVVGMHVGEKKTVTIAAKDGYGEKDAVKKEVDIPARSLQDKISQDIPADNFQDTVRRTVPKSNFPKSDALSVGQVIDAGGVSAKIVSMDADNVTFEFSNQANPFHGKKIEVGATTDFQGNTITISAIKGDNVTVDVDNKTNPFYGKTIAPGLVGRMPNGDEITILSLSGSTVKASIVPELAGKTLIFDIEVTAIKGPAAK